ncbi:MAG: arginine--tRNA ligase [Pseudomonadota bacterium]
MKAELQQLLVEALDHVLNDSEAERPQPQIERARDTKFGDFACNIAMMLAKPLRKNPREIAQSIIDALPDNSLINKVEIAGPGFINFYLSDQAFHEEVSSIVKRRSDYGQGNFGAGKKVLVEFVSANPTGPLHVGHGRHAAYGDSIANLLAATGHDVTREYYVNDAGRQMDILAASVWLRYLECQGEQLNFPQGGYKGQYIVDIAKEVVDLHSDKFVHASENVFEGVTEDAPVGNKDSHIDGLVGNAKSLLGEESYRVVQQFALDAILSDIRDDLEGFGVNMDAYYSERQLTEGGKVREAIKKLKSDGFVYEHEGAMWFKATEFGDEKDRVVVRKNGQTTYIASDIAYHYEKRQRGFDLLLDVLGADHHGYIARTRAALEAMGEPGDSLEVQLVQFAVLYRGGEKVQMSTRSGEFVTLRELREEVGNDPARFFYVMRSNEQHLDFDLDLAKSNEEDTPINYIGYAHARACSLLRKLSSRELVFDEVQGLEHLHRLDADKERGFMSTLTRYPEIVELAARNRAPQNVVHYLKEVANEFHSYYWAYKILDDQDDGRRNARLVMFTAAKQVIANGLALLGVRAPEQM